MNKLDIHAGPHLSTHMTDWIMGDYEFEGLDHESRVFACHAIIKTIDLVMAQGQLEHTGDWDWRITVIDQGGNEWGTTETSWSDTMYLSYETVPEDYIDRFARWNYLSLTTYLDDDDTPSGETYQLIPIDSIRTIIVSLA